MFRSQLKFRSKGKGETTAELAQAIRKLTRQAYPQVSLDVVPALSVDHFIDALPESEIRLCLREVGPTISKQNTLLSEWMHTDRLINSKFVWWVKLNKIVQGMPQILRNRWKANEWICFQGLFKTLVISKGYTCLCTPVMLQTKMRITITDQIDQT